jgi:hypothetical protein
MAGFQIVCQMVVLQLLGALAGPKGFCPFGWSQQLAVWQLFLWLGCFSTALTWALVPPELAADLIRDSLQNCRFRQICRVF